MNLHTFPFPVAGLQFRLVPYRGPLSPAGTLFVHYIEASMKTPQDGHIVLDRYTTFKWSLPSPAAPVPRSLSQPKNYAECWVSRAGYESQSTIACDIPFHGGLILSNFYQLDYRIVYTNRWIWKLLLTHGSKKKIFMIKPWRGHWWSSIYCLSSTMDIAQLYDLVVRYWTFILLQKKNIPSVLIKHIVQFIPTTSQLLWQEVNEGDEPPRRPSQWESDYFARNTMEALLDEKREFNPCFT